MLKGFIFTDTCLQDCDATVFKKLIPVPVFLNLASEICSPYNNKEEEEDYE